MKKKKLTLEELRIESFITTMGLQQAQQLFGGLESFNVSASDAGCGSMGGCVGGGLTGGGGGAGGNTVNVPGGPCDPYQTTVRCNTTSDCNNNPNPGNTGGGPGTTPPNNPPAPEPGSFVCYSQIPCYGG